MATMLNTKIRLRYDSYTNWKDNNPILLAGEVAIVVPGDAVGSVTTAAPCLMKVGDGIAAFNALPWMSAAAADVHAWAKLSVADFKEWIEGTKVIDGMPRPEMATKAQLETVSSNLTTLSGRVGTLETEMDTVQSDIDDLKESLGTEDGGLAGKLTALEGRVDTAEGEIDTLQTNLGTAKSNITTNTSNIATNTTNIGINTQAISTLNGDENTAGSVAQKIKVETERATQAEGKLQESIDTLNAGVETEGSVAQKVESAVSAEATARESAITEVKTSVAGVKTTADAAKELAEANQDAIEILNGTTDTEGSVRHTAADVVNTLIGGADNADTITNVKTLIDYVNANGGSIAGLTTTVDNHTTTLSSHTEKITALQNKDTEITGSINTIDANIGAVADLKTTNKTVVGAINETYDKIATDDADNLQAAKKYADDLVKGLNEGDGALVTLESRVSANEAKLAGITDKTVVDLINDAQTATDTKIVNLDAKKQDVITDLVVIDSGESRVIDVRVDFDTTSYVTGQAYSSTGPDVTFGKVSDTVPNLDNLSDYTIEYYYQDAYKNDNGEFEQMPGGGSVSPSSGGPQDVGDGFYGDNLFWVAITKPNTTYKNVLFAETGLYLLSSLDVGATDSTEARAYTQSLTFNYTERVSKMVVKKEHLPSDIVYQDNLNTTIASLTAADNALSSKVTTLETTAITGVKNSVDGVETLTMSLNGTALDIVFNCGTSAN